METVIFGRRWSVGWVALLCLVGVEASAAQGQDDQDTPPFLRDYIALTRQLDELHQTQTTYRMKVDSERIVQAYNERVEADMDKSFVLVVKDLDVEGPGLVRIEIANVEGLDEASRLPPESGSLSIVAEMDEEEAYRVDRGSRIRVAGKPKLLFRPGPNVRRGRAFQESVIAGWRAGDHTCFLLFPRGKASLVTE